MGITLGIFNGIFPASLGTYDNGDFEHSIVVDEAFGMSIDEKATTLQALVTAGMPLAFAMSELSYSQADIDEAVSMVPPAPVVPTNG